jgi:hypothetical protein
MPVKPGDLPESEPADAVQEQCLGLWARQRGEQVDGLARGNGLVDLGGRVSHLAEQSVAGDIDHGEYVSLADLLDDDERERAVPTRHG